MGGGDRRDVEVRLASHLLTLLGPPIVPLWGESRVVV